MMEAAKGPHDTITAGDQVRDSYYGLPVIKAPHWRWLIIIYFFLGGIGGASSIVATVANLVSGDRAVERAARYISLAAIIPAPLLLVLDLGRPERAFNMFRIVKLKSMMSVGSWALLFAGAFAGLAAILQFLGDATGRPVFDRARRGAGIAGVPFFTLLAGYTGVLLSATNVPLWWRSSPFLGPTFLSSAFSTSLAALSIVLGFGSGEHEDTARKIARAESVCLAAELTFMTATLIRLGKIGKPLTSGRLGMIFWPVTYVGGVLLPLILQLNGPAQGRTTSRSRRTGTALLALTGGFALRALMIFAGRASAKRPQDYFALTGGTRREVKG